MGILQGTEMSPQGIGREGWGRQGQRGKAGPQQYEGWRSLVNLGNPSLGAHNEN